jgi:hypothetical protein
MKTREFHVLVSVHNGTDWNEWTGVPGFTLIKDHLTSPEDIARTACMIVHHERTRKVQVYVYNRKTKLYDQEFNFAPIKF